MLIKIIATVISSLIGCFIINAWKDLRFAKFTVCIRKIYKYHNENNNVLLFLMWYLISLSIIPLDYFIPYVNVLARFPFKCKEVSPLIVNYSLFLVISLVMMFITYFLSKHYLYNIAINSRHIPICNYRVTPYININGQRYCILMTLNNDTYLCQTIYQIKKSKMKFEIISPDKSIVAHVYYSISLFTLYGTQLRNHVKVLLLLSLLMDIYILLIIIVFS